MTLLGAVLSLVAVESVGLAVFLLVCREPERWPVVARFGLAFGLGLIALDLSLFICSLAGFPPTLMLGAAIVVCFAAAAALSRGPRHVLRHLVARNAPSPENRDPRGMLGWAALVVLVGLCAVAGVTSLLEPVVDWDVLSIWVLKAKVLLDEPVGAAAYFHDVSKAYSHLDYPLLWPMAMAWTWCCARSADLTTVKVLSPALIVAIAASSLGLLRRVASRPEALLLATVTVGLPMLLSRSSRLLADAPMAYFALAAFACCHLWLDSGHGDDLKLAGLFSAGMLFTKNEGVAFSAILLVAASAFLVIRRRSRVLPVAAAWLAGFPLLLTGAWFAFRAGIPGLHEDYGSRIHPAYLLENASRIPKILWGIPRYAASFDDWLFFWPMLAIVVVLTAPRWARTAASFLVLSVGLLLLVFGFIYVVSPWELDILLETTTGRLLLQIAPVCVYLLAVCAREAGLVSGPGSRTPSMLAPSWELAKRGAVDRTPLPGGHVRSIVSLLVAFLPLSLLLAGGPTELPSTPAGQVLAGYLEALNSGNKDKLEAFIKAHRPDRPDALDRMLDLRWNTGGLDLYSIESSQALNVQAVLHEREGNGTYNRMSVTVSDGDPAVITNITLVLISPPAGAPVPGRLTQRAAVAAWKAEIDKAASAGKFSGVWLWAKNGKAITSGARGKADRETGINNTLNTRFRIGSMNKMFTAVATLQLVERGKLSLDDTIGKLLPDYPNANVASKVKVRHLLSHTGGTGDIFGPEFEAHRLELKTLQDYVKLYGERDLQFEPGTKWEYSNYGFLLLGVLIEKVSGKSYYDFVAENIYKVAGMTNSGSEPENVKVANRSKGYMRDRFVMVSNEPTLPWRGTSAGGGYTTAADLMKFAGALMSNRLLKAETLAEATRPQFTTGAYGFGFQLGRPDEARTYGHGGGAPGMNAILRVYPESGQSVIVLCNLDSPSASRMGDWLHARMPLK